MFGIADKNLDRGLNFLATLLNKICSNNNNNFIFRVVPNFLPRNFRGRM